MRQDSSTDAATYLDSEPVGWCAVAPRSAYIGLVRNKRVPWEGRAEDKTVMRIDFQTPKRG
jgi:hypothetical protein